MVSVENSGRYDIDVSRQRRAGRSPYATWQLHATTGRRWPRPRTPRPPQPGPCPGPRPASRCGCYRVTSRSSAKAHAAGGRAARDPPPGPTSSGRVRWCSPATGTRCAGRTPVDGGPRRRPAPARYGRARPPHRRRPGTGTRRPDDRTPRGRGHRRRAHARHDRRSTGGVRLRPALRRRSPRGRPPPLRLPPAKLDRPHPRSSASAATRQTPTRTTRAWWRRNTPARKAPRRAGVPHKGRRAARRHSRPCGPRHPQRRRRRPSPAEPPAKACSRSDRADRHVRPAAGGQDREPSTCLHGARG